MYQGLFESTAIPVLEQVVQFSQSRHHLLAGNIANLGLPGYRVRDLSVGDFQKKLQRAMAARQQPRPPQPDYPTLSPGALAFHNGPIPSQNPKIEQASKNLKTVVHDHDSKAGLEHQVSEMVKNQMQHNLALAIMSSQFRLLQTAISERV
ncbi:MAG: flagellar basal body rod protein FlgB [Planctomycetota bacterium]|jgi:flagellar basal-body rod protein FlgB